MSNPSTRVTHNLHPSPFYLHSFLDTGFLSRSFHLESSIDESGSDPLSNQAFGSNSSTTLSPDHKSPVLIRRMPLSLQGRLQIDPIADRNTPNCLPESSITPVAASYVHASYVHASVAHYKSTGSSDSREDSPKMPPSPVLRTLRSERPSPIDISRKREGRATRKISGLLASSSSEDEDEGTDATNANCTRKKSSSTEESTPSPRTPNSCKILSGIEKNQATAFYFPPSSPFRSRPSSLEKEKHMNERQSSDETRTTISSMRSRSTSSEVFDDVGPATSLPGNRSHRINPLRKQAAIAEEAGQDHQAHHSATDSGLYDCPPATPPNSRNRSRVSNISALSQSDSRECLETALSLSESEGTYTSSIFRKVTIKKRVAPIPCRPVSPTCPLECDPPRPSSEPFSSSSCHCKSSVFQKSQTVCQTNIVHVMRSALWSFASISFWCSVIICCFEKVSE